MSVSLDITMNTCVSTLLYLQQEVRRAHWNIKGPSFYALHTLLGEMKDALEDMHDPIAERAVALGIEILAVPVMASMPSSQLDPLAFPEASMLSHIVTLCKGTQIVLKGAVESPFIDYVTIDVITTAANALSVFEYKLLGHWVR